MAAYLFAVLSVGGAYRTQGNAPLNAAAFGLCSMVTAVSTIAYGVFSFFEKEKNYRLAKFCLAAAGVLLLFWVVVLIVAF